jgi:hypothetical protein
MRSPFRLSELRPRKLHLLLDVALVQLERLLEHARELPELLLEPVLVLPREARVEDLARHALDRGRDREAEDVKVRELGLGERAVVHGVYDLARVLERAALAVPVLAARPAGVDQPAVDLVRGHPLREHLRVPARVEHDERGRVARREGRDRLQHAVLCSGRLPVRLLATGERKR